MNGKIFYRTPDKIQAFELKSIGFINNNCEVTYNNGDKEVTIKLMPENELLDGNHVIIYTFFFEDRISMTEFKAGVAIIVIDKEK